MTTTWDVIVIGGGLAGLTAAATATRAGASTVLLEAHQPGGRARTTEGDGFVMNLGAHALYLGGEALPILRSLGITPTGAPPPLDRYVLRAGDAFHRMPTGPSSLLRTTALGRRSKAALAKLLVALPRMEAHRVAGVSVADWLAGRDLRNDAVGVLRSLVRLSTYCDSIDDLSAEAAILQLRRAADRGVLYLDGGWSQLTDGLRAGVDLRAGVSVRSVDSDAGSVTVHTSDGSWHAHTAVVAAGTPESTRAVLGHDPGWGDLGRPVIAAALDAGVRGVPFPGYVLGVDHPVYGTTQSPPARQAPDGDAVVSVVRYGSTSAPDDRAQLERWLGLMGVEDGAVVTSRFLARMTVAGAMPRAAEGGMRGRPTIDQTGHAGVFLAGDWVGPHGLLADAAIASGHAAALAAVRRRSRAATMVV